MNRIELCLHAWLDIMYASDVCLHVCSYALCVVFVCVCVYVCTYVLIYMYVCMYAYMHVPHQEHKNSPLLSLNTPLHLATKGVNLGSPFPLHTLQVLM